MSSKKNPRFPSALTTFACAAAFILLAIPVLAQQSESTLSDRSPKQQAWRESIKQAPIPGIGCFKASYPSTQWEEAPCNEIGVHTHPIHRQALSGESQDVGDGNDYALVAPSGDLISKTVGSFPSVIGVTSETGVGGISGSNEYSLQINTNFNKYTSACSGGVAGCTVWQQFIYATDYEQGSAAVFMQYWLIGYGSNCPSGFYVDYPHCFKNSPYVSAPDVPITGLGNIELTGAAVTGGNDTVTFTYGTQAYSVSAADSVLEVGTVWDQSEFNVFGDAGGSQAAFNTGTAIAVNVAAQYGSAAAPTCASNAGSTAETNNLTLSSICYSNGGSTPNIQFLESNATPASHAGMTWTTLNLETPIVRVGADSTTNAYSGDAAATTVLPILCLDVTGAALPAQLTPTFYDGWAKGNLRLSAPISGTLLTSRAVANEYCALNFGAGWRMTEFHDGWYGPNLSYASAWHLWGNALGLFPNGQRFWTAIDDQVANPWGE